VTDTLDIQPILQSDQLHAWSFEAESDIAVIATSGIGYDTDAVPAYEFAKCATNNGTRSAVFLSDPNRSWLSLPDLIEGMVQTVETFAQKVKAKTIVAMGHSLGGFTSLILPAFTKIDRVIALAPQMSVSPEFAPDEDRWQNHRAKITNHRIGLASDHFVETTHYSIVHGLHKRDKIQRDLVPHPSNVRHYLLPKIGHDVSQRLKKTGALQPFVNAICEGRNHRAKMILKTHFNANLIAKKTTIAPTPSPVLEGN